ncbi:integrase arm-type DNA-binding domain-containing protein [Colwellia sp. 20A7]|uniref:integrase arm-type DNA-binding domain-containing protein n=1 Tax=Colwellia sp. 20A7 TaxID=2689569 RepID=UPI00135C52E0|nr:integrase arm-type DNA-binding domain-containing protein [Colwellia sp. 20A7]
MAKITKPLSNTEVKNAKPKDKEYNLSDGEGLSLRIKPKGSKLWIFNYYRPYTKKRANIGFGQYPALSLAEARKLRSNARELLAKNIDPKTDRDDKVQEEKNTLENTFGKYADTWKILKTSQWKEPTIRRAHQTLTKHALPTLKDLPISQVKPKQIIAIMKPLIAENKRETVKRLCSFINQIMRLAVADGSIEFNPISDLSGFFPTAVREHFKTLKPEQLPYLLKVMARAKISDITRCMFELQLHTAVRPVEAATARWEEFNLEENLWIIPANKMKKNREHIIPLSPQVINLLDFLRTISGKKEYLFPGVKHPSSHANRETVNTAMKRNGLKGQIVSHGLRALFSTTCNEQNFESDIIETSLAHLDKDVTRRSYNRSEYLERRKKLMCWWSDHIEKASVGSLSIISLKELRS